MVCTDFMIMIPLRRQACITEDGNTVILNWSNKVYFFTKLSEEKMASGYKLIKLQAVCSVFVFTSDISQALKFEKVLQIIFHYFSRMEKPAPFYVTLF